MAFLVKKVLLNEQEGKEIPSRAVRRVILNADVLKSSTLSTGDAVVLSASKSISPGQSFSVGIVWPSAELSQDNVLVSSSLLLSASLSAGQLVHVSSLVGAASSVPSLQLVKEATTIRLREISPDANYTLSSGKAKNSYRDWLNLLLKEYLVNLRYITASQILQVFYESTLRTFSVSSISSHTESDDELTRSLAEDFSALSLGSSEVWTVGWDSTILLVDADKNIPTVSNSPPRSYANVQLASQNPTTTKAYAGVGGLDKQTSEIQDLLEIPLTRPDLFRYFGLKPPRGILLHGPPGTGKTHLARAIAASTKSSVLIVNGPELSSAYHGETESKLRDVFRDAKDRSPCIVVLDEVDALVPRREDGGGGEVEKRVVATLLTLLDGMEDDNGSCNVVVIGTTNRPNAIDPALRRPGRFDREIEIGIPDVEARLSILRVLLANVPHSIPESDLRHVASRAHGYVGADLSAVVREAGTLAIKRSFASESTQAPEKGSLSLTTADLLASLPTIRPSAMRSVFIETPPVKYSDIGGQEAVIKKLREAVEWPLLYPDAFRRLGVRPPKGLLLYGPPGCSKTVLARACASESGVNFVAVKGPELLNKYVGESERGVREIFRKARAAAPSIMFFDEIDALGTTRSDDGTSAHEGVLTSLLNEMDGVQELIGVTIIAATNRPDALDAALIRPGRLDRILYVGPPDRAGREEILRIRMRSMQTAPDVDVEAIAELAEGCSGAEMNALCQEAALLTMQKDMNAPYVPHDAFVQAAKTMNKQITPDMLQKYQTWRLQSGIQYA